MKVLVTGGTGFVSAWTAKAAQDDGHQVKFLVRNPDRLHTSAEQIGIDVRDHVVGDIADPGSTAAALRGCDAVIHCAAMVSTDPARCDEMLRTNLEGARNVLGGAAVAKFGSAASRSRYQAQNRAAICGRCLVGESATRRGFGWCRMALYRQLRAPFGTTIR
jgi:dihydroflavonol-4-reductase